MLRSSKKTVRTIEQRKFISMSNYRDRSPSLSSPSSSTETVEQRAKIFAALADPTRLRIVETLIDQTELSGSEIAQQVGISLALFCHHSKILAEAGLLHIRKEGQTKYNSLNSSLLQKCFSRLQIESETQPQEQGDPVERRS
jgi:DNA-binding transcriptional ArsR family regulator